MIVLIHTIANHAGDFDETIFALNEIAMVPIVHQLDWVLNEQERNSSLSSSHHHYHHQQQQQCLGNGNGNGVMMMKSDDDEKRRNNWNSNFPISLCTQCQPKLEEIEMIIRDEVVNVSKIK